MTGVRLVSFDLWSTLATGSVAYQQLRAELVAEAFESGDRSGPPREARGPDWSIDAVQAAITAADVELDALTERTGQQHGFIERLGRTRELLGAAELSAARLAALREEMGRAFAAHPPTLTEPTLPRTLAGLRRLGLRVAVTSNTGYVPGRLVRPMLDRLGILRLTDYQVFSDEVGYAKPSLRIYQHLTALAGSAPAETLHVGDNRRADYAGAVAAGLRALWYRPGGPPAADVLLRHQDLLDHPLVRATSRTTGPRARGFAVPREAPDDR